MAAAPWLVGIGLVVAALAVWAILLYNRLVTLGNRTEQAWANVDVILRQRSDEVRNLVATVKGYAAHEKQLFEDVAKARAAIADAATGRAAKAQASDALTENAARLIAVGEAYPELKASDNFLALQKRLSSLEDMLADRREFYNHSVVLFNTRIQEIPDVWLAQRMRLAPKQYFKADSDAS
jgi:LemA protein